MALGDAHTLLPEGGDSKLVITQRMGRRWSARTRPPDGVWLQPQGSLDHLPVLRLSSAPLAEGPPSLGHSHQRSKSLEPGTLWPLAPLWAPPGTPPHAASTQIPVNGTWVPLVLSGSARRGCSPGPLVPGTLLVPCNRSFSVTLAAGAVRRSRTGKQVPEGPTSSPSFAAGKGWSLHPAPCGLRPCILVLQGPLRPPHPTGRAGAGLFPRQPGPRGEALGGE